MKTVSELQQDLNLVICGLAATNEMMKTFIPTEQELQAHEAKTGEVSSKLRLTVVVLSTQVKANDALIKHIRDGNPDAEMHEYFSRLEEIYSAGKKGTVR